MMKINQKSVLIQAVKSFDFSTGCGHCKKMKPEYDEAAEILNKDADVSVVTLLLWVNEHRTCVSTTLCVVFSSVTSKHLAH